MLKLKEVSLRGKYIVALNKYSVAYRFKDEIRLRREKSFRRTGRQVRSGKALQDTVIMLIQDLKNTQEQFLSY